MHPLQWHQGPSGPRGRTPVRFRISAAHFSLRAVGKAGPGQASAPADRGSDQRALPGFSFPPLVPRGLFSVPFLSHAVAAECDHAAGCRSRVVLAWTRRQIFQENCNPSLNSYYEMTEAYNNRNLMRNKVVNAQNASLPDYFLVL